MNNSEEKVKTIIKEVGIRLTTQRKAVLKVLIEQQGQHLRAEDIYDQLREQGQEVGLATIYRTLDLLEEKNLVACRSFDSDSARYEYIGYEERTHHHLVCKQCGKIIESSGLLVADWQDRLAVEEDFAATDCCVQIKGYCKECR